MIRPDDQPDTIPVLERRGRTTYAVRREWRMEWQGILIIARKGYRFDAASIPRVLWTFTGFTPDSVHRAASLAHDIGCDARGRLVYGPDIGEEHRFVLLGTTDPGELNAEPLGQLADHQVHLMWAELLRATEGQNPLAAWLKGLAVRLFGPRWINTRPPPKLPTQ